MFSNAQIHSLFTIFSQSNRARKIENKKVVERLSEITTFSIMSILAESCHDTMNNTKSTTASLHSTNYSGMVEEPGEYTGPPIYQRPPLLKSQTSVEQIPTNAFKLPITSGHFCYAARFAIPQGWLPYERDIRGAPLYHYLGSTTHWRLKTDTTRAAS